jgi:hypothetical protein
MPAFYAGATLVTAAVRARLYVFGLGRGLLGVLNTPGFVPRRSSLSSASRFVAGPGLRRLVSRSRSTR